VKREQLGWNVNLKILEPLESALDWEEKRGKYAEEARGRECPVWGPSPLLSLPRGEAA